MMRSGPVLLGGEQGLRTHSRVAWTTLTWLPVVLCLCAIGGESTDAFSSSHTSGWLRHLAEAIFGPISQPSWEVAHHAIRKTGHFVGYGLMGLAWLRAWLLSWRPALLRRGVILWRSVATGMALVCTLVAASTDELHQTFIPSRTGLVSDAWLDTAGAAAAILLLTALSWRPWRRQQTASA